MNCPFPIPDVVPLPRLELKLPVHHRVNFDTGCDQGYGSERSPEEEVPPALPSLPNGIDPFNFANNGPPTLMVVGQMGPPLPLPNANHPTSLLVNSDAQKTTEGRLDCDYDFITKGEEGQRRNLEQKCHLGSI